jgi:hypothetical protein
LIRSLLLAAESRRSSFTRASFCGAFFGLNDIYSLQGATMKRLLIVLVVAGLFIATATSAQARWYPGWYGGYYRPYGYSAYYGPAYGGAYFGPYGGGFYRPYYGYRSGYAWGYPNSYYYGYPGYSAYYW